MLRIFRPAGLFRLLRWVPVSLDLISRQMQSRVPVTDWAPTRPEPENSRRAASQV
jgi:hypothetical protein